MKKVLSILLSLLIILSAYNVLTFSVFATELTKEPIAADISLSDKEVKASPITEETKTISPAEESDNLTTIDVPKIAALNPNKINSETIGENTRFVHYAKNWKYIYEKNDADKTATIVDVEINLPAELDDLLEGSNSSIIPIDAEPLRDLLTFPSVIEGYTVTKITGASSAKEFVNAVIIPGTVKTIGISAFSHFEYIHTVELSAGVTTIEGSAFDACTSLKNINLPEGLVSIGNTAFRDCKSLEELTLPESLTSLGYYSVFIGCSSLKTLNYNSVRLLTNSDEKWNSHPFMNCGSLEKIVVGEHVEMLDKYIFAECTGLKYINIPDSVTSIGKAAFLNTKCLISITIPSSVKSIESDSFTGSGLETLNLNSSLETRGDSAFHGLENLKTVVVGNGVTRVRAGAFHGCTALTDVTLSDTVTTIGGSAFDACTSLKNINLPEGLISIGNTAFRDCKSLEELTLPESLTSLGYYSVFIGCSSLKTLNYNSVRLLTNSDEKWNSHPFMNCGSLEKIVVGEHVEMLDKYIFAECTGLKEIIIPKSVTSFGNYVFLNDDDLTVYGYTDSAAQSYCKSNSIRFVPLDSLKSGDTNGDNVVDILDATVIQKFTVDKASLTDEQKAAADVNGDGVVDILDATDIQKFAVEKITEFNKKA